MKRIVIIGASSGIGQRMAADFARVGCRVAVAARREAPLKEMQKRYPDRVVYSTIDVTEADAVSRFYDLIEKNGGMDYLVYASGVGFNDPYLSDNKISNMVKVNALGMARITAAAYRYYKDTVDTDTPGHIAVITSVAGVQSIGIAAAYSATKAFQQRFIRALRQLARQQQVNVRYTDIRPGFIRTDLLDATKDYPLIMDLDYAAPRIETAVLRGCPIAYIDWRWGIIANAWRLIPPCLWTRIPISD